VLALAAVFGLQYALAQTGEIEATSTPPVGEVVTDTSTSAVTTSSDVTVPEETTPATEGSEPPAEVVTEVLNEAANLPDQSAISAKDAALADVTALQDAHFKKNGRYLQVLKGNGLPDYENGNVSEKLGKNISDKAWVHVYEAPGGKGYQVMYEDAGVLYSIGYGPEAAERTFERTTVALPSATSTSAIIQ
jgi:hypothetical protein